MIFYQGTTSYWPAEHPDRSLASGSDTEPQVLPRNVAMLEQGGSTAEDKDSVPVSPRRSQPREARSRRRRRAQATVLVVDDEAPVREMLVELLSIHGYRVITAASVGDAEEAKQQLGVEGLHLVITDIHLTPGRQIRAGYALAQRWRAEQPGLPIILVSGDPSNQELPEVRDGSLRFVLKPFRMEVFLEAVREALGR
jgi:CheY-like chemotaxis protein